MFFTKYDQNICLMYKNVILKFIKKIIIVILIHRGNNFALNRLGYLPTLASLAAARPAYQQLIQLNSAVQYINFVFLNLKEKYYSLSI